MKHLVISKGTELLRVPVDALLYICSDGNYSTVCTLDGRQQLVSFQLGQLQDLLAAQIPKDMEKFMRVGRSLIINLDYVYFIDTSRQKMVMSDCRGCSHELVASREALQQLKVYLEQISENGNE